MSFRYVAEDMVLYNSIVSCRGGTQYAWGSAGVIAPLVIGVILLGVFIWVEIKLVPLPM